MQTPTKSRSPLTYFPSDLRDGFSPEETAVLDSIQRRVGAADSLDAMMNMVFESTRKICPCDRIGLAFLEEDGRQMVCKWVRTLYEPVELDVDYVADVGEGSLRKLIEKGYPRIINDLEAYLRRNPRSESTRLLVGEGVRSSMTCPLKVEGRNVGVMFRSSRQPEAYDTHQLALHLAIEERLSQAVEKAYHIQQLTAAKDSFTEILGFVSHELKNPLTTVVNDAWALTTGVAGALTPKQKGYTARIQAKADHLTNLIRQYLDLARLDDDGLALVPDGACDFRRSVVEPVVEIFRSHLERKGMELKLLSDERDLRLSCDPDMMKIVMANLLGNAVKYGSDGGEVRIRWQRAGDLLRTSVFNTGPGFSAEERSKLFRRFSRIQSPELLQQSGTGLGLYNVWRIVRLHEGKVHADSSLGEWAEFSFEIPLSTPAANEGHGSGRTIPEMEGESDAASEAWDCEESQTTGSAHSCDGLQTNDDADTDNEWATETERQPRVLAIDDDPDISRALALRLRPYGIDVFRSFSGMQGYWMGLDSKPDVILTDLSMPDGEGNYIYSRFRGHPLTEKTPVIVLTGQDNPALKRQMLSMGVSAYLTKPINWAELLEELRRHIDFAQEPQ